MTPTEEVPMGIPQEQPQVDCEAVKKEWDEASKTGRVSAELMQKALECQLVPEDKVKSTPTGEDAMPPMPTREENPLAGEDEELKDLGMAELVMAEDDWYDPVAGLTPGGSTYNPGGYENLVTEGLAQNDYVLDDNGNWTTTTPGESTGGFDPFRSSFVGTGTPYYPGQKENNMTKEEWYAKEVPDNYKPYISLEAKPGFIEYNGLFYQPNFFSGVTGDQSGSGGEGGRIMNTINPNYFSGSPPQKPEGMGNMEWYYRYGNGMYGNQFNPESFYFNPNDKGNAGQTSSPYTRIGNRGNMTPEVVQSNRPFYDDRGINKYTDTKLMMKNKLLNMAEATDQAQMPTGAGVDQLQGQGQEVDEQIQEQLKEALMNAGFNVVDIGLDQEGKIFITVGQFEDSYMENAQFITFEFGQEDEARAALERMQKEMTNQKYIDDTQKQMKDYMSKDTGRTPPGQAMSPMARTQTPNYFANQLSRFMTAPIRTANNVWTGVNNWANNTTVGGIGRGLVNIPGWYAQDTMRQFGQYRPQQPQVTYNPGWQQDFFYNYPRIGREITEMPNVNPNFNPSGAWRNSMQPTPSVTPNTNNWSNYMFNTNPTAQQPFSNNTPQNQPRQFDLPSYRDAMFSPSLNFTFAQQMDEANSEYFEQDFELAEPQKCSKRFKAIAVTPGMYAAKDGTQVELSSEKLQSIAGLFRNKPIVLVDHELARPDSTHEGSVVGFIENSWYDPDFDAVLYKGVLNRDLDLAGIAGSSIKLSYGKYPMGRHIALIPKCMTGKACYAPQDPNAVILENAQKVGDINMRMTPEQAFAMKKELEHINNQKESLIDGILKKEIEAGTLKGNIFDRTRELWKNDAGVLLEMATVIKKDEPTTKPKVEGKGRDLDLATAIKTGKVDPEEALTMLIENGKLFGE